MLLSYHDRQFVEVAYRLFLNRDAEPEGLAHHVDRLRSGVSRREVAYLIGTSPEAKEKQVDQHLFWTYRIWRKVDHAPVIGTLVLIIICLMRFKRIVAEFRRVQNAVFGGLPVATKPVSK
jgi:hypothetical protein